MTLAKQKHVAVIGSGPAGLAAAYSAALNGAKVTLFEQMNRCGMKLLASGGGKCNVTNALPLEDFARSFGKNWRFLLPALGGFFGREMLEFFELHQIKLVKSDGFHYFPEHSGARGILDMWLGELEQLKVDVKTNCRIDELAFDENRRVCAVRSGDKSFPADAVVLCCGGKGYPVLGGSERGYDLARQAGHTVTALYPAMTGVKCREEWVKECAGLSLDDVSCYIDLKSDRRNVERGELLFTHNGFSAFAILDLAGRTAELLEEMPTVPFVIDFLPQLSVEELHSQIDQWRRTCGKKSFSTLLSGYFPRRLTDCLIGGDDAPMSQLKASVLADTVERIKKHKFDICGVESWDKAMVTRGGVLLKEVFPDTLGSRLAEGVFFAGELLDVTGRCGGYNITWAFASGMCAGTAAASK